MTRNHNLCGIGRLVVNLSLHSVKVYSNHAMTKQYNIMCSFGRLLVDLALDAVMVVSREVDGKKEIDIKK